MSAKWKIKRVIVFDLLLYMIFAILMIGVIGRKENLYVDEVYSYGLANHAGNIQMDIKDGVTYYPSSEPWINYMTVSAENRFDYVNVWRNQANDVHPPLYYFILHTLCSVFTNIFSIWFAAMINMVFAFGVLFFVRKIVMLMTGDRRMQRVISIAFICSTGILSATSFLRMYVMAMYWMTALTYLLIRQVGEKLPGRFYPLLVLCTVGGALTHYYCIVYSVLISISFGCCLLYQKYWKDTVFFCLAQGVSAALSIAVFPAMISHVFSSGRGNQSADNLTGTSFATWMTRSGIYFDIIDRQLFGSILLYLLVTMIIIVVVCGRLSPGIPENESAWRLFSRDRVQESENNIMVMRYLCSITPILVYFLLIAKISVYLADRYMYPVYGILFAMALSGASQWIRKMAGKYDIYIMAALVAVVIINGWRNADWTYLYRSSAALVEKASEYGEVDCIFVYEKPWEPNPAYYEASKYHSVTFFAEENLDMLASMDLASRYQLVLMTAADADEVIAEVQEICPELSRIEYLGGYAYTNTYCLSTARDE